MDIEYVNDTKIESKANRNKLIWRKTMETNQAKLMAKISGGPSQIDDAIGQDKVTMDITFFAIASNIKKMC